MAHLESDRGRGSAESRHPSLGASTLRTQDASSPVAPRRPLPVAQVALLFLLLVGWEAGVRWGLISPLYAPAPMVIGETLITQIGTGSLPQNLAATLMRTLVGLSLGGAAGLLLGYLMGWSPGLRRFLEPMMAAAHPLPKIAILPLIMVVFGIGEASLIIVVATAAFFPLLINTLTGVMQILPQHFEVAKAFGAGPHKQFQRVVVPGSLPYVLAGLRLALNGALLLTIAVEIVGSGTGLGASIWMAWVTMRVEHLYATLFVITLVGLALNMGLNRLSERLLPWQADGASSAFPKPQRRFTE